MPCACGDENCGKVVWPHTKYAAEPDYGIHSMSMTEGEILDGVANMRKLLPAVVRRIEQEERERCAKIAESTGLRGIAPQESPWAEACRSVAANIRRG